MAKVRRVKSPIKEIEIPNFDEVNETWKNGMEDHIFQHLERQMYMDKSEDLPSYTIKLDLFKNKAGLFRVIYDCVMTYEMIEENKSGSLTDEDIDIVLHDLLINIPRLENMIVDHGIINWLDDISRKYKK